MAAPEKRESSLTAPSEPAGPRGLLGPFGRAEGRGRCSPLSGGVAGADLENGLLHVDLIRAEPETVIRKVEIGKRG